MLKISEINIDLFSHVIQNVVDMSKVIPDNLKKIIEEKYDEYIYFTLSGFGEVVNNLNFLQYNCPSTGRLYITTYPKNIDTIDKALLILNSGISKEQFALEC